MTRLSIVLLAAVMVSALYLVRVQYDSLRAFPSRGQRQWPVQARPRRSMVACSAAF